MSEARKNERPFCLRRGFARKWLSSCHQNENVIKSQNSSVPPKFDAIMMINNPNDGSINGTRAQRASSSSSQPDLRCKESSAGGRVSNVFMPPKSYNYDGSDSAAMRFSKDNNNQNGGGNKNFDWGTRAAAAASTKRPNMFLHQDSFRTATTVGSSSSSSLSSLASMMTNSTASSSSSSPISKRRAEIAARRLQFRRNGSQLVLDAAAAPRLSKSNVNSNRKTRLPSSLKASFSGSDLSSLTRVSQQVRNTVKTLKESSSGSSLVSLSRRSYSQMRGGNNNPEEENNDTEISPSEILKMLAENQEKEEKLKRMFASKKGSVVLRSWEVLGKIYDDCH
eukprot:scaffold4675_cov101-Cylindrotheca_fusiformis.AAC.1